MPVELNQRGPDASQGPLQRIQAAKDWNWRDLAKAQLARRKRTRRRRKRRTKQGRRCSQSTRADSHRVLGTGHVLLYALDTYYVIYSRQLFCEAQKIVILILHTNKGGPERLCNLCGGGGGGHEAVQRPGFDPGGAVLESEARRMIPPFLS